MFRKRVKSDEIVSLELTLDKYDLKDLNIIFDFFEDKLDKIEEENFIKQGGYLEDFLVALFSLGGFHAYKTGKGFGDGGVDVVVEKENEKYLIQAKHYSYKAQKVHQVGVEDIRAFYGVVTKEKCKGLFITTSIFSDQSLKELKNSENIIVFDRRNFFGLIAQLLPSDILGQVLYRLKTEKHTCEKCKKGFVIQSKANKPPYGEFYICSNCGMYKKGRCKNEKTK